jgi:deoxycytidine triphosphate deaminase
MGILNREEIRRRFQHGELIRNPRRNFQGDFEIESASYDMAAGTAIWKDPGDMKNGGKVQTVWYDHRVSYERQPCVTLQPGQMMFVLTEEEISMPEDLCGTVYSRNKLARDGILALNAGHIDPGYKGPIAIRMINLRSIPYSLRLGAPIYTVVFHELFSREGDVLAAHREISKTETVNLYTEAANAALSNAFLDPSLIQQYVRIDEFGKALWDWLKTKIGYIAGIIVFIVTVVAAIPTISEWIKKAF